jgi:magnesium-transporting ATPase (P-type)
MKHIRVPAAARHERSDLNQTAQVAAPAPGEFAAPNETTFWREPAPDLLRKLQATPDGLTSAEARQRLEEHGPNEPAPGHGASDVAQLLHFFLNPLVIILLIASLVSAILGERVNAAIIATIVLLSIALNCVQAYRSQRAIERLRAGVAPTAAVLRDGRWVSLPRRELVPGDISAWQPAIWFPPMHDC